MKRISCQLPRALGLLVSLWFAVPASAQEPKKDEPAKVSYYQHIRPIFQAHCQGCHQPAKARGDYIMTDFARLLAGGASGEKAVIARDPARSSLVQLIVPVNGAAKMPEGKKPLADSEIELIKKWIAEGAVDDTPSNARQRFDPDHPPLYTRQLVITSIDFSPDGKLLAAAGFHEVLLVDVESGTLAGRLIGLAERIESVRFSPDGKRLAVSGGLPGRMGEIQVWEVERRRLLLSTPITFDTVYGASWSPDGTQIAFGCGDNTVRAIDAKTGEQILYQGAHSDWALDTVFSKDGKNVVSVSRDMTVKLTEVATQRFIDNVTSITPGALKGGIMSIARHPERDEIVLGGSDGVVKVYRIFRQTNRVIGDDANLIRKMPAMAGRTWSVAVSKDGKRIAAGSSLDGAGQVDIYGYEFDTKLPDNIRAINTKVVTTRTPAENEALEKYHTEGVQRIARTELKQAGIYAVAFHPDGRVAAAGSDGIIRFIDPTSGTIVKEIAPAPLAEKKPATTASTAIKRPVESVEVETPPAASEIQSIDVQPKAINLAGKFDYVQVVVTARLTSGDLIDVTRMVEYAQPEGVAEVARTGLIWPKLDGKGTLTLKLHNQSAVIPIDVTGLKTEPLIDFIRDVNPVLTRLGCNAGTCHGAAGGKNGFKLSLRGYDPLADVRALTDDLASRRVNIASPDDSLMLLKSTGAVPHVGSQLTRPGEPYYEIIRAWIASGARLNLATPRVTKIDVEPVNPVVQKLGGKQQLRVTARYADGKVRDVSREAFIDSGNTESATAAPTGGLMTAIRRGEAAMLVRFEGAYAATTLTVMGDRAGFAWQDPPVFNKIDELTAAKWKRMKIQPSELSDDAAFLRRVHIDLTGLPPTADEVRAFLADNRETKVKRDEVIDRLVGSEAYVEYWTNKWADLLQVNRKFLGAQGAADFRKWIRNEVAKNTPYDEFARKVLTASGSNKDNPPASYFKILRDPDLIMENTTHLFLAVRFNCNKCHDHPFERWTQDNYYETAAFFARVGLAADPKAGGTIGGTAVEKGKPLYEIVADKADGEMHHQRTNAVAAPRFPYEAKFTAAPDASRRQQLAGWITAADNPYFAKSYVNRLWGYLFGVGIIDPIDDIRAGNPPTNPELLDYLTREFIDSGFNVQHVLKLIARSRTYQLSVATNKWNQDDKINYSHASARRLPAEVLLDSVYRVTGSPSKIPGVPAGTRAAALPDSGVELPSGFLATFGRPARESSCECERSGNLQLGPVMALVNGQTLAEAIGDPGNDIAKLVAREADDAKLVNELFLRVLNRPAAEAEIKAGIDAIRGIGQDHDKLVAAMKKREQEVAAQRPRLEAERQAAIARAKAEHDAYQQQIAAQVAEQTRQRNDRIAQAETALKQQEAKLAPKLDEWVKAQSSDSGWVVLKPTELKASVANTKLELQPDGSVFVSGANAKGNYSFTAETDLKGITGIRLEALTDDRLPMKGPGRSPNGNFVLSEFEVTAAPKGDAAKARKLVLQKPQASFSQQQYDIKTAIDGKAPLENNGWAIHPQTGIDHWAIFEIKDDVGHDGGTLLKFTLDQQYQDRIHTLGKFRILVTTEKRPIQPGLPAEIVAILKVEPDRRTPEQQTALRLYFFRRDAEYVKLAKALEAASQPLPVDPRLKELEDNLAFASRPIPEDPLLVQLRQDVDISTKQLANPRLTGAQDIAWALINSPAFLFNR